jgi:hypothetical protein
MQRGRRSADAVAAELQVLSPLLPGVRPEPPEHLTAEQMQVWQAVVDRMPSGWFTSDLFPALPVVCARDQFQGVGGRIGGF